MTDLDPSLAAQRLTDLWVQHRRPVADFVRRRLPDHLVDDAVVDVFTVAWQKIEDAPPEPRPWLFAIARNVVGTHLRTSGRWAALAVRTASFANEEVSSAEDRGIERVALQRAWNCLTDGEREVLALAAWDGLTSNEAAAVLGCLRSTYSVRLTRARRHLRVLIDAGPEPSPGKASGKARPLAAIQQALPDQAGPMARPESEGART